MASNAVNSVNKKRVKTGNLKIADVGNNITSVPSTSLPSAYYVNAGLQNRPCEKAFECSNSIELNFNYWMTNKVINDTKIIDIIRCLLSNETSDCLRNIPLKCSTVILVCIHGLDPRELGEKLDNLQFLSSCSRVPVHHVALLDDHNISDTQDKKWQYMEAECMNSLLFWPERRPLSLSTVSTMAPKQLFTSCSLIFHGTHTEWLDEVSVFRDSSVTLISLRQFLNSKLSTPCPDKVKERYNKLLERFPIDSVLGRFRRSRNGDGGVFVYDCTNALLYLLWHKLDADVLLLEGNAINGEQQNELFSFRKVMNRNTQYQDVKDLSIVLSKATLFSEALDRVLPHIEYIEGTETEQTVQCTTSDTLESDSNDEMDQKLSSNHKYYQLLSHLSNTYHKITKQDSTAQHTLDELVLSPALLQLMGYPLHVDSELGHCIATHSPQWSLTYQVPLPVTPAASVASAMLRGSKSNTSLRSCDTSLLEEGEEIEDCDDCNYDSEQQMNTSCINSNSSVSSAINSTASKSTSNKHIYFDGVGSETEATEVSYTEVSTTIQYVDGECIEEDVIPVSITTPSKCATAITTAAVDKATFLPICAIDCEMCTTEEGLELSRITVICPVKGVVYDTLVKPKRPIIDYNTEFSGITAEALQDVTTTINDVHKVLKRLINAQTIIVGHSLDSDLKVLHIVHLRVIDTAALYPHPRGLPFKHSLRNLAKDILNKVIQEGSDGHDSVQDSAISLELAFLKCLEGHRVGTVPPWAESSVPRYSLFEQLTEVCTESTYTALNISVHSSMIHPNMHTWERHAFGYRTESDLKLAAELFLESTLAKQKDIESKFNHQHRIDNSDTVHDVNTVLSGLSKVSKLSKKKQSVDDKLSFIVAELVLSLPPLVTGESNSKQHSDEEEDEDSLPAKKARLFIELESNGVSNTTPICQLQTVDRQLRELYEAAPSDSVMLVLTQGEMDILKQLSSRKMRNRWEYASFKKKLNIADCSRPEWDSSVDEQRLIAAAAHAIAGCLFITRK